MGPCIANIQGGSNMTGTDLCVKKCKQSRSYLNHLVLPSKMKKMLRYTIYLFLHNAVHV